MSLDANTFKDLSNLQNLKLDDNQLSSIDSKTFQGLSNFKNFELNNKQLNSINAGTFESLSNLNTLSFYKNLMDETTFHPIMTS